MTSNDQRSDAGEVHIVPRPRAGTWAIYVDAGADAVSEHPTETAAEAAAQTEALLRGVETVVLHDRYHRTHRMPCRQLAGAARG
jgi:Uncharacterized protein conserved in bacteria (DUF2188)